MCPYLLNSPWTNNFRLDLPISCSHLIDGVFHSPAKKTKHENRSIQQVSLVSKKRLIKHNIFICSTTRILKHPYRLKDHIARNLGVVQSLLDIFFSPFGGDFQPEICRFFGSKKNTKQKKGKRMCHIYIYISSVRKQIVTPKAVIYNSIIVYKGKYTYDLIYA